MKRRAAGFTLIELMMALTIAAILLAVGVPSFKSLIARQKVKTAASSLQVALNQARGEALKRNANVTLAPNTSGDWTSGWTVTSSGGTLLYTAPALTAVSITGGPATVVYQGTGRTSLTASSTFKITATSTDDIRCVDIDPSGLGSVASSGC